jgi:uncharacterized protein with FMN-binding domain
LAVGAVVVGAAIATSHKTPSAGSSLASTSTVSVSKQTSSTSSASTDYKDGTYSATGSYYSPGGKEELKVNLSLSNDTVVAANVVSGANDPTAESYQSLFISGYKSHVIGKKINSIKLTNVSGSSLTSQGFNNALKQIEQESKA